MLKKILHSAIVGLVSAAVILFVLPKITEEPVTPEAQIVSYKRCSAHCLAGGRERI